MKNLELKMQLIDKYGIADTPETIKFCKEAYKFITEDAEEPTAPVSVSAVPNGLYIVYDDGTCKPFTGNNPESDKEGAVLIGVAVDGHTYGVTLKDKGSFSLVRNTDDCPEEHPLYRERQCDALSDWDFIERTKHIQEVGTDIPLDEGEYVPSLPVLVNMCHHADKGLNKALEFIGGEPLKMDKDYWSSTEGTRGLARLVLFPHGVTFNGNKYYGHVVRAVTAFNYRPRA